MFSSSSEIVLAPSSSVSNEDFPYFCSDLFLYISNNVFKNLSRFVPLFPQRSSTLISLDAINDAVVESKKSPSPRLLLKRRKYFRFGIDINFRAQSASIFVCARSNEDILFSGYHQEGTKKKKLNLFLLEHKHKK